MTQHRVTETDGVQIAYETFGSPLDPPVVLIMGLGAQMIGWHEDFCDVLAREGHFVIRFDNRDIGLSTHLDSAPVPDLAEATRTGVVHPAYTLSDMAGDVIGLLDALELPSAHLVGASMGGMIAQVAALEHRRRVRSLVSLMSTTGDPAVGGAHPEALRAILAPAATTRAQAIARALAIYEVIGSPAYPLDRDHLTDLAGRGFDRGVNPDGVTRQFAAILAASDRTDALHRLRLPTLVIHGEDDCLVHLDGGLATADAVPGAELLTLAGMGHDLPRQLWPDIVRAISRHVLVAELHGQGDAT